MAAVGRESGPLPFLWKDPRLGRTARRVEHTPQTLDGVGCFVHLSKLPLGATPGSWNPWKSHPQTTGSPVVVASVSDGTQDTTMPWTWVLSL